MIIEFRKNTYDLYLTTSYLKRLIPYDSVLLTVELMITRIVKMSFVPERFTDFSALFERYKTQIAQAEGCVSLRLVQAQGSSVCFTISEWQEEKYLEQYRQSALFATVWSQTKTFFNAKPEAWTTEVLFISGAL